MNENPENQEDSAHAKREEFLPPPVFSNRLSAEQQAKRNRGCLIGTIVGLLVMIALMLGFFASAPLMLREIFVH
jgi:hypothetical protein